MMKWPKDCTLSVTILGESEARFTMKIGIALMRLATAIMRRDVTVILGGRVRVDELTCDGNSLESLVDPKAN